MKKPAAITCVFLDLGGVLLTDGWARPSRRRAARGARDARTWRMDAVVQAVTRPAAARVERGAWTWGMVMIAG